MVDVKKRRLVVLLAQDEEDGLDKLEKAKQKEHPSAKVKFSNVLVAEKWKLFTTPEKPEIEAQHVSSRYENCAGDDLEDIVDSDRVFQFVRRPILHRLGPDDEIP